MMMMRLCLLILCVASLSAAVEVSAEVGTVLKASQDAASPDQALAVLTAYTGKPHALISLAIAQAHHRLASAGPEAERAGHRDAASKAYTAALERDPGLQPARFGLARLAADADDWHSASSLASEGLDLANASTGELEFAANAALRANDRRLAATLIDTALVRFPRDERLRRIDLALLLDGGRDAEARSAALDLLDRTPGDRDLWLLLARADHAIGRDEEALAASEAALACNDGDRAVRRYVADQFLARGWPQAALPHYAVLMGEPTSVEALADAPLVELAVRCASDTGDVARARTWITAVPEAQRTRGQRLLAARIAVEQGDTPTAAAALDALIALGETDPDVLAWAGELAETRGDEPRAAAFYGQALGGSGAAADAARLRLAALRLRQGLLDEAATLIDAHLARHPDDATAHSLRAVLDQSRAKK